MSGYFVKCSLVLRIVSQMAVIVAVIVAMISITLPPFSVELCCSLWNYIQHSALPRYVSSCQMDKYRCVAGLELVGH